FPDLLGGLLMAGLVMLALFIVLVYLVGQAIFQNRSFLRVTKEGLQVTSYSHTRKISWPDIKGFRLCSKRIALRARGPNRSDVVQSTEMTGHLRIVMARGEFVLPDRYGVDPGKLMGLLSSIRSARIGDNATPEAAETQSARGTMTPVLQLRDFDILVAAAEHLSSQGFSGSVIPIDDLSESECRTWISPAVGEYVLCLSANQDVQQAMLALARHLEEHKVSLDMARSSTC
ncbi:MAG: hypothetical protein WC712_08480, partial [Candidatus Brocadiia bacterium]